MFPPPTNLSMEASEKRWAHWLQVASWAAHVSFVLSRFVSVRSALLAPWSRAGSQGPGCLSGAAQELAPGQSHVKGMLIVRVLPHCLNHPLPHCVRVWGLFRFVFGFSMELVFGPGWLGSQGRPIAGTCASHLFIPVKGSPEGRGTKPTYVFGPNMVRPALPVCLPPPPRL